MTRTERSIYFDMRTLYLKLGKPLTDDMELLSKRLRCVNDEEINALNFLLKDKFKHDKKTKTYHQSEWDLILKNYKFRHRNGNAEMHDETQCETHDETVNKNSERLKAYRERVKKMVSSLTAIGVKANSRMTSKELNLLCEQHNVTLNDETLNNDETQCETVRNAETLCETVENRAITINQEPVTNNQDKNNTTPCEQNFDIRDWVEPEYSEFIEILQDNDIHMALPNDLYLAEAQKFKNYNANLAAQGKVSLVDDSYRMTKFIDWFKILANKQHASKQAVAAPVVHDDDLPEIYRQSSQSDQTYHPSHAPVAPAKKLPGMFSAYGQNYMPLHGMDGKATFDAVTEKMGKFYTFAEAYQILKDGLSGEVA